MIQQLNLKSKCSSFFSKATKIYSRKPTYMAREKEELVYIKEFNKAYAMKLTT